PPDSAPPPPPQGNRTMDASGKEKQ
ncbi:MAG: hypothetical protein E1N59_2919, partial [Puniceicoccaceae bacterium 5H]